MTTVLAVQFHRIHPSQDVIVPLDEAWAFFEDVQRRHEAWTIDGALIEADGGARCYYTFAKAWMVWDFTAVVHRLARIGLGAYGYDGPVNPAIPEPRPTIHLVDRDWVSGINFSGSYADRQAGRQ